MQLNIDQVLKEGTTELNHTRCVVYTIPTPNISERISFH
jgi:hypothetical protein